MIRIEEKKKKKKVSTVYNNILQSVSQSQVEGREGNLKGMKDV